MKQRHKEFAKFNAEQVLKACGVPVGADFYSLRSGQVDALLEHADWARYQKPKNANGSRGRYWHDFLQRRAKA